MDFSRGPFPCGAEASGGRRAWCRRRTRSLPCGPHRDRSRLGDRLLVRRTRSTGTVSFSTTGRSSVQDDLVLLLADVRPGHGVADIGVGDGLALETHLFVADRHRDWSRSRSRRTCAAGPGRSHLLRADVQPLLRHGSSRRRSWCRTCRTRRSPVPCPRRRSRSRSRWPLPEAVAVVGVESLLLVGLSCAVDVDPRGVLHEFLV